MPKMDVDPFGDDQRKKVALALQYQKGLFKKTPMGDLSNGLLALYNQQQKPNRPPAGPQIPQPSPSPTPPIYSQQNVG